ncbi:MAG: SCO family protein [Chloroflexi bacterium]|nr:SCO family protein [Chloroflexota bacterium]
MKTSAKLILIIALFMVFFGAILVAGCARPYEFHGMVLQPSDPIDFTLTAHTGERVSLSDFRGKYVVLFFGYTFCPDVCPLTLAELSRAMQILGDKAEGVQVIMVTVDPERDTAERLANYVPSFHPDFIGLTGSADEIAKAATPLGIFYAKNEVEGASGYLMDHTASVTLLDKEGRVRLVWPFGTAPEDIASDLEYMLKGD